ncbi:hypothetical protein [Pseudomonas grimontii]|uniref:hypothetical protein n=1 Tax=Pseudomonas grimontii TaxID=129847 RepID=UPI0028E9892A|nr:hypothetical protein [Pseudomonas grimontii]
MCDLARDMNRAMCVVERADFLDDLGDRVIRKIKLEISMKRKAQGHTKTETLTFRVSPRMKHLMDIMSRRQRRSLTAICECAIEQMASPEELRIAETTWSTDELERTLSLYRIAPHLCTYDEEVEAKKYTP